MDGFAPNVDDKVEEPLAVSKFLNEKAFIKVQPSHAGVLDV